jgi:hypothetical protein
MSNNESGAVEAAGGGPPQHEPLRPQQPAKEQSRGAVDGLAVDAKQRDLCKVEAAGASRSKGASSAGGGILREHCLRATPTILAPSKMDGLCLRCGGRGAVPHTLACTLLGALRD